MALPFAPDFEVAEDLTRNVGFDGPFDGVPKTGLGVAKLGQPRGYVKKAEGLQVAEQGLVSAEMRGEVREAGAAVVDIGECDHRRETWEWGSQKERKLVDKKPDCRVASGKAFINLGRKSLFGDTQRVAEEMNLFLLGFEEVIFGVLQDKVQEHEARADVIKGMPAAVAEVILFDGLVDGPGKEMKNRTGAHVIANGGVRVFQKLQRERGSTLPPAGTSKGEELTHGEVARVGGDDIEEARLGFRVAQDGNLLDMGGWKVHGDQMSFSNEATLLAGK